VIAQMAEGQDSYNCDAVAIAAACAALDECGVCARDLAGHSAEREKLSVELERRRVASSKPGKFPARDDAG